MKGEEEEKNKNSTSIQRYILNASGIGSPLNIAFHGLAKLNEEMEPTGWPKEQ